MSAVSLPTVAPLEREGIETGRGDGRCASPLPPEAAGVARKDDCCE